MSALRPPLEPGLYLIYTGEPQKGWWGPDFSGYSFYPAKAGIYTAAQLNERFKVCFEPGRVQIVPLDVVRQWCEAFLARPECAGGEG